MLADLVTIAAKAIDPGAWVVTDSDMMLSNRDHSKEQRRKDIYARKEPRRRQATAAAKRVIRELREAGAIRGDDDA